MASQACRKRARRTDRRLDQEHVPAAHGVLGGEVTAMPRGLDHVIHAVRDLEAAAELYRRLGFTVGARNQHSWGTHNHLVQLPGFFLELLTVAEPQKLGSDGLSALFGTFNRVFLKHQQGLSLLILESEDAAADATRFRSAAIGVSDAVHFEREGKRPDGVPTKVGFSLAFARDAKAPAIGFAVCQQHFPENFWNPAFQQHPNTASAIGSVVLVAENPTDHHIFLSAFTGIRDLSATSSGITVSTPRGDIRVMDPAAFRSHFGTEPPDISHGARVAAVQFRLKTAGAWSPAMNVEPAPNSIVAVGETRFGNGLPLALIAGPCALESRDHALEMASALKEIAGKLRIGLVYKTSFDKANRTSARSNRGVGLDRALPIFAEVRQTLGVPILTDVHEAQQCPRVAEVVDVLQIPAFLCRQTDLLLAAAATGRVVNVKKGQFLAPWDMANVVAKITAAGNPNVLVTERGASFGYNSLVSDMRGRPILARTTGAPVIFDATHSVQQPGGKGTSSGGEREFVPVLARAAVAVGVAGVFIETHPDPDRAPSDGPNMVPLREFEGLVKTLMAFDALAKSMAR